MGAIRMAPVSVCHQVSTMGSVVTDLLAIPHPGSVDSSRRAEQTQRVQGVLFDVLVAHLMKARMAVGAV